MHQSTISAKKKIKHQPLSFPGCCPSGWVFGVASAYRFHSSWRLGLYFPRAHPVLTQIQIKEVSPSSACHVRHHTSNKELHLEALLLLIVTIDWHLCKQGWTCVALLQRQLVMHKSQWHLRLSISSTLVHIVFSSCHPRGPERGMTSEGSSWFSSDNHVLNNSKYHKCPLDTTLKLGTL